MTRPNTSCRPAAPFILLNSLCTRNAGLIFSCRRASASARSSWRRVSFAGLPASAPVRVSARSRSAFRLSSSSLQRAGADQRHDGERLRQDVGERDVDRALAELLGQLDGAVAALEVLVRVPDADELLVVALVAAGAVGEEAARLARPGEVRRSAGPSATRFQSSSEAMTQPAQIGVHHLGQRKVVGERARAPACRSASA